jgi:hypothetical protein
VVVTFVLVFLTFTSFGQDLIRAQVAREGWESNSLQPTFLLMGILLLATSAWYLSRLMLYLAFPGVPGDDPALTPLRTWIPRLLGIFTILGLSYALYSASLVYGRGDNSAFPRQLQFYAWLCIAGALIFLAMVSVRRSLSSQLAAWNSGILGKRARGHRKARGRRTGREDNPLIYGEGSFQRLDRNTRRGLYVYFGMALALFVLFIFGMPGAAPAFGVVGLLLFAASGWIVIGCALDVTGMRYRIPFFIILFAVAVTGSGWNDNHAVRESPSPTVSWNERASVTEALKEWMKWQLVRPIGPHGEYPLFLVSAEGGGIRAAYWTALVLGEIQNRNPCFADQLFSMSGVSGGSLGVAVFAGLLRESTVPESGFRCGPVAVADSVDFVRTSKAILSEDFLSPLVGAMLYPDLVQRFMFVPVSRFDRARALEEAWERAWRVHRHSNRFAEPFDNLWNHPDSWMPALFFNSTWVEGGRRLIVSNLRVTPREPDTSLEFTQVEDLHRFYGNRTLPLSAAVHLSARFPFVSPAGALVKDGVIHGRAVDGGYIENSGAITTNEIVHMINELAQRDRNWLRVRPIVIHISNSQVDIKQWDVNLSNARQDGGHKPAEILSGLQTPIRAITNARNVHDSLARETLRLYIGDSDFLHFGLCRLPGSLDIPLGWSLSSWMAEKMELQLKEPVCPAFDNLQSVKRIDEILKRRHAQVARR